MPRLIALILLIALAGCGAAPPRAPARFEAKAPTSAPAGAPPTPAPAMPAPARPTPEVLAALPAGEPADRLGAAVGVPFTIPLGGQLVVGDTGLRVGFAAVPEDSRCPADARCIWPGRAVVTVEVLAGDAAAESLTLAIPGDLTPDAPELQAVGPFTLRLVDLAPYPSLSGGPPAPYIATLVLERPAAR